jgi:type II secretory pathway component GspD/PulD (secretin)
VNDKVVGTQTIDNNAVPIIGTEELETTVTVTNGQTVVLGGLITERTERTINGVPILIQIPLIKHLFGTTKDVKNREELMIFIQPRILDTNDQILRENVSEVNRIPRGEEIIEFAVPEYPEIKAQAEAEAAAAQGKPVRKRPSGGLLQKLRLFPE